MCWRLVGGRTRTRTNRPFAMRARTRCASRQNTGHAWGGPPGALAPANCRRAGLPVPHVRIMEHTAVARAPQNRDAPVMDVGSEAAWATAAPATSNMSHRRQEPTDQDRVPLVGAKASWWPIGHRIPAAHAWCEKPGCCGARTTAHVARGVFSPKGDMYMSTPSTRRG